MARSGAISRAQLSHDGHRDIDQRDLRTPLARQLDRAPTVVHCPHDDISAPQQLGRQQLEQQLPPVGEEHPPRTAPVTAEVKTKRLLGRWHGLLASGFGSRIAADSTRLSTTMAGGVCPVRASRTTRMR